MVERDDRSPVATFFTAASVAAGATVALSEAAAHHARVKRLEVGSLVRLTDGTGRTARGRFVRLSKNAAEVFIDESAEMPKAGAVHLRVPSGDRDRMLWLAEKATELGVASWQVVRFRRSMSVSPRGEGSAFSEKVRARMISALEQSAGAWLPQRLDDATPETVDDANGATRILLDVGGEPLLRVAGARAAVILFGPEGGMEATERETLISAGWRPASLAATTLRFETAGIAAVAIARAAQLLNES